MHVGHFSEAWFSELYADAHILVKKIAAFINYLNKSNRRGQKFKERNWRLNNPKPQTPNPKRLSSFNLSLTRRKIHLFPLTKIMRRVILSALILCLGFASFAQTDTTRNARMFSPMQVPSSDHFMIQIGSATWQNSPDSLTTKGFSRTFNMYVMLDFPFKTNPHFSVALGPGIATDHIFLDKRTAGITGTSTNIVFRNVADTSHFKKYKVSTAFLEVPVELRFSANPEAGGQSFKVALGAKVGTMLAAWTKGKTLQNSAGNTINDYTEKLKSKRYFNTTRLSVTGRIGYGHFTLFGSYALTPVFKEGVGPKMNTLSVGLNLGGL